MTKSSSRYILAFVLATSGATAQVGASTLSRLTQHADVIVRVRALATHTHGAELARAQFRVQQTLRGDAGASVIELTEPAGRACGRALHGVAPGVAYLAFLRQSADGALSLLAGGSRSLVRNESGLESHIAALLSVPEPGVQQVVAGLDSISPRVRGDASVALATIADLGQASDEQRARIASRVLEALHSVDRTTPSLLVAAARLQQIELVGPMLDSYLAGRASTIDRLLRRCIAKFDPAAVAAELTNRVPEVQPAQHARLIALAEKLTTDAAQATLQHLLSNGSPSIRLRAGAAWLRADLDPNALRQVVTTDEYRRCVEACDRPPALHSIRRIR